jgi:hypothetical protein
MDHKKFEEMRSQARRATWKAELKSPSALGFIIMMTLIAILGVLILVNGIKVIVARENFTINNKTWVSAITTNSSKLGSEVVSLQSQIDIYTAAGIGTVVMLFIFGGFYFLNELFSFTRREEREIKTYVQESLAKKGYSEAEIKEYQKLYEEGW